LVVEHEIKNPKYPDLVRPRGTGSKVTFSKYLDAMGARFSAPASDIASAYGS
jgi:hypothetical protein